MSLDARNLSSVVSEQQRRRPVCAYAQSDQCMCYSIIEMYHIYSSIKKAFSLRNISKVFSHFIYNMFSTTIYLKVFRTFGMITFVIHVYLKPLKTQLVQVLFFSN